MHASTWRADLDKKRTRFVLPNLNFIAVQIFTRLIGSPLAPAFTPATSLRGLAIRNFQINDAEIPLVSLITMTTGTLTL